MRVDLNSDMGESFGRWSLGDDQAMLGLVSSANVACGFHAGDPRGIAATLCGGVRGGGCFWTPSGRGAKFLFLKPLSSRHSSSAGEGLACVQRKAKNRN